MDIDPSMMQGGVMGTADPSMMNSVMNANQMDPQKQQMAMAIMQALRARQGSQGGMRGKFYAGPGAGNMMSAMGPGMSQEIMKQLQPGTQVIPGG